MSVPRLFLGERGGARLFQADRGYQDAGLDIPFRAETDPLAPAGAGGEAIFTAVYLVFTLGARAVDLTFSSLEVMFDDDERTWDSDEASEESTVPVLVKVTPIVDGRHLETQTVQLAFTSQERAVHVELGISEPLLYQSVEVLRAAARGTWFQLRVELDALPDARFIVDGAALEYEVVRESIAAQAVSPA